MISPQTGVEASTVAVAAAHEGEVAWQPPGPGATLGRYVVIEERGRGGAGVVLRAYDPKLQREVALKVMRPQVMSEEAQARMIREARAMAMLSHANVVAVYDVDLDSDAGVVLAMEYVDGTTLGHWLAHTQPDWRRVISAFVEAGRGLAAAHRQGLLHRDFKPANVLVGPGGQPIKVTDFGLARAGLGSASLVLERSMGHVGDDDGVSIELTRHGVVLGTPAFMPPEQHRGHELTAAVDQYAFCVALWQGLVGQRPFIGPHPLEQKEKGPPPWPASSPVPRVIVDAVRRGLAPSPEDRWPSMDALLEVLAAGPSRARTMRRRVAGVVLTLGLAGGWYAWARAQAQACSGSAAELADVWDSARREEVEAAVLGTGAVYAPAVWQRVGARLDGYAQEWVQMHGEVCRAAQHGESAGALTDQRMACLSRAKIDLRAATDILVQADAKVVAKAHDVAGALPTLARCADPNALTMQVAPPSSAEAPAVQAVNETLATARSLDAAGRYEEARGRLDEAAQSLAGISYPPIVAAVALARGHALQRVGEYATSEAVLGEALQGALETRQWDLAGRAATHLVLVVGSRRARHAEGLVYADVARGLVAVIGDPLDEAMLHHNTGNVLNAKGEHARALAEYRSALALWEAILGEDHPHVAMGHNNVATVLEAADDLPEAEAEHRRALATKLRILGPEHPGVAVSRLNLGSLLVRRGNYAEAEPELRQALAILTAALGPDHPDLAHANNSLAFLYYSQRDYVRAEPYLRQALTIWEAAHGSEHPSASSARENIALILHQRGEYAEAEALLRRVRDARVRSLGPDHPDVAASRANLGRTLGALGRFDEAEVELRTALAARMARLGLDHGDTAVAQQFLADVLMGQQKFAEAADLYARAYAVRIEHDALPDVRGGLAFGLARALYPSDPTSARRHAEQSIVELEEAEDRERADDVRTWLRAH